MLRNPIVSSSITSAGYDYATETLEIEFPNGVYQYQGVPSAIYQGLIAAESAGKYFREFILNQYPTEKV